MAVPRVKQQEKTARFINFVVQRPRHRFIMFRILSPLGKDFQITRVRTYIEAMIATESQFDTTADFFFHPRRRM
jgi:hypothetical protein